MVDMAARSRSAVTLAVLGVLLAFGVAWGWSQVTDSYPGALDPAPCTTQQVSAGEQVRPAQVMVSVLNASDRAGLAGQTMNRLKQRGFGAGELANTRAEAATAPVVVWGNPDDAAARLLAIHLGNQAEIVEQPSSYPGITIVLGKNFSGLGKDRKRLRAEVDTTVCVPN